MEAGGLTQMSESVRKLATYQDVLDAPADKLAQLIDGELILSPRPANRHSVAASRLGEELGPQFGRTKRVPGGWIILYEPELHLGTRPQILVPDLCGWRREKMAQVPDEPSFTMPPDWVCEVLSPSTAGLDRVKKLAIYAAFGVRHVWLVDPREQTLEVLRLEGERWLIAAAHSGEERVRAEPFDAIELDLSILWADVARPTS